MGCCRLSGSVAFECVRSETVGSVAAADLLNAAGGADLAAGGSIVVKGTGVSAEGGNSLRFARAGQSSVILDASTGLEFSDHSAIQITAALGGSVPAGQWMLTVRNACSIVSAATQITRR